VAVVVDGKLDEWAKPCPIPLLSANQLVKLDPAYAWTKTRDLPPIAQQTFKEWWRTRS